MCTKRARRLMVPLPLDLRLKTREIRLSSCWMRVPMGRVRCLGPRFLRRLRRGGVALTFGFRLMILCSCYIVGGYLMLFMLCTEV